MMTDPLVSITRVTDSEMDPEIVGGLDYTIHCQALESWLAAGAGRVVPQTVQHRQSALAAELRELATQLEAGAGPFQVTVEYARRRYAERMHAMMRYENSVKP